MSERQHRLALVIAWLVLAGGIATLVISPTGWFELAVILVPNPLLTISGTVIVLRTEQRLIGWLLIIPGILFPYFYAFENIAVGTSATWPLYAIAVGPLVILPLILLMLVFPNGRFPSRVARHLARAAFVIVALGTALDLAWIATSDRKIVVVDDSVQSSAFLEAAILSIVLVTIGALVVQRRAYPFRTDAEKRQIKWFLLAILGQSLYLIDIFVDLTEEQFLVLDMISTSLFPIAVLIAITRYRLYEIDRLISRTLAYALVVSVLAGMFVGGVTLLTTLLPTQSQLAVAVSTLAVAALFNPLRRRAQDAVDRRFNRHRYLAQQVVDDFGRRITEETDSTRVQSRLAAVIGETMAPETVGIWQPPDRAGKATARS